MFYSGVRIDLSIDTIGIDQYQCNEIHTVDQNVSPVCTVAVRVSAAALGFGSSLLQHGARFTPPPYSFISML